MSTRLSGVSQAPFDTLNLRAAGATESQGDSAAAVAENRRRLAAALGAKPVWLQQVHGAEVVRLTAALAEPGGPSPVADASVCTEPGLACAVLVADCLPLLMCSPDGRAVAAAHAGWRGLAAGVAERTLALLCEAGGCAPHEAWVWLGACIGPRQFEVGADVLAAFGRPSGPEDQPCFVFAPRADGQARWLADLPELARQRLRQAGVSRMSGGQWCTVEDRSRFFSFRRDSRNVSRISEGTSVDGSGRMAAAIAIGA
jgi:polyphenol oxidase